MALADTIPKELIVFSWELKGKAVDVRQIGRDLGVRYVLEGSLAQGGNRVRVNAQLIDADTGAHLWADQFDADRTDLLDMQDEIVTRLSRALQIRLIVPHTLRERIPAILMPSSWLCVAKLFW